MQSMHYSQHLHINSINLSAMAFNYHKRLTGYLSQTSNGLRRAQSHNSFSHSQNHKYYASANLKSKQNNPHFYQNTFGAAHQNYQPSKSYRDFPQHTSHNQQLFQSMQNKSLAATQYFGPEIKAIRNTLIDIRDQMKNGGKFKANEHSQLRKTKAEFENGYLNQNLASENQINSYQTSYWQTKLQEKDRVNKQFIQKIQSLEEINLQLSQQINQLKEDNTNWQSKTNSISPQLIAMREKLVKAEREKNSLAERQRALQIKIMDLRSELMKCQQAIRQMNFREEQEKQARMSKKMGMAIIQQFNVTINWKKEDENRSSQTYLSDIDIQKKYKEINQLQDLLCDRINSNLVVEKKIFSRISEIDNKISFAYNRLYQVQQNALKLGIGEPI